eukprot:TRINITY_DN257_c0_g2_i3.p3 TRINITY_DN257_c0_g2~~TRINITY_DN257_c0_g2_i3.p3  ORF type:complete len:114 (+),score=8.06 TRINITY_DN257_c0_g2_i3:54-395(+)
MQSQEEAAMLKNACSSHCTFLILNLEPGNCAKAPPLISHFNKNNNNTNNFFQQYKSISKRKIYQIKPPTKQTHVNATFVNIRAKIIKTRKKTIKAKKQKREKVQRKKKQTVTK